MDPNRAFNTIVSKSPYPKTRLSTMAGKGPNYLSVLICNRRMPQVDTFAKIADICGWDLLARNRETGEELLVNSPDDTT